MFSYGQQIIRVNGENGARAYQMMPNCSALLLDETAPLVWVAQTDGAGYKTITPYSITKYEPEPQPDFKDILNRLTALEEKFNEPYYRKFDKHKQNAESISGHNVQQSNE